MKKHYFYIIHSSKPPKDEINYLKNVEKALINNNSILLEVINYAKEDQNKINKSYMLDNGIDVRYLYFTRKIKKIDEKLYERILKDDENIIKNMSNKSKKLLKDFGFNANGWHLPFIILSENKNDLESSLINKFGFLPEII